LASAIGVSAAPFRVATVIDLGQTIATTPFVIGVCPPAERTRASVLRVARVGAVGRKHDRRRVTAFSGEYRPLVGVQPTPHTPSLTSDEGGLSALCQDRASDADRAAAFLFLFSRLNPVEIEMFATGRMVPPVHRPTVN
jgi:hypothetical protein